MRKDNSSLLVGSKVICCVQVQVKEASLSKTVPLFPCHLVYLLLSPTGSISTLASSRREICHYLHQPSTWGYQRGELTTLCQANFWRRCRGVKEVQVRES